MKPLIALTKAGLVEFLRNRQGLFWSFFFPIFFLVIFGSIFGRRENGGVTFKIGLDLQDTSPEISWVPTLFQKPFVVTRGTEAQLTPRLEKNELRAVVIFPKNSGEAIQMRKTLKVRVLYVASQQMSEGAANAVRGVIGALNQKLVGIEPLAVAEMETVGGRPGETGPDGKKKASSRGIDYLLPGILAMTIMQLGLFAAIPIINLREKGIMKRLRATPLKRSTLVGSQIAQRMVISIAQTGLILAIGVIMYQFRMAGSWLALIGLVVFGVMAFISIGAVLSGIAKTQEAGVSLVQLAQMPMLFLCDIFFPSDLLPEFIKPLAKLLPATYLADALRNVMLAAPSAYSLTTDIAMLAAWMVGMMLIATRIFRWE